jgi:hypothetical protein
MLPPSNFQRWADFYKNVKENQAIKGTQILFLKASTFSESKVAGLFTYEVQTKLIDVA